EMRTEFVCIPRPITRSDRPDGGPLPYRVVHTASLWKPGERPLLRQQVVEGMPGFRSEVAPSLVIAPAAMPAVGKSGLTQTNHTRRRRARNPKSGLTPTHPINPN